MKVAKALSDETRVRILAMLSFGELCVCDIIDVLGLAPSTVSKHLSILYQAHLINARKEGKWILNTTTALHLVVARSLQ